MGPALEGFTNSSVSAKDLQPNKFQKSAFIILTSIFEIKSIFKF